MHFRITSDANFESGVGSVVDEISGPTRRRFASADYGAGLVSIVIVLMCRDPALDFKRRIRFSQKDKALSMDVMLNLEQMRNAKHEDRIKIVFERIANDVSDAIAKYSLVGFDDNLFKNELNEWFQKISSREKG